MTLKLFKGSFVVEVEGALVADLTLYHLAELPARGRQFTQSFAWHL